MENKRITVKTKKQEIIDMILETCTDGLRQQRDLTDLIPEVKKLDKNADSRKEAANEIKNRNDFYFGCNVKWLEKQTKRELKALFENLTIMVQTLINSKKKVMAILKEIDENKNCEICNDEISKDGSCPNCEVGFIFSEQCSDCNNKIMDTKLNEDLCNTCDYNYNIYQIYSSDYKLVAVNYFQTINKAVSATLNLEDGFYVICSKDNKTMIYKASNNICTFSSNDEVWEKMLEFDSMNWSSQMDNEYYVEKVKKLYEKYMKYVECSYED